MLAQLVDKSFANVRLTASPTRPSPTYGVDLSVLLTVQLFSHNGPAGMNFRFIFWDVLPCKIIVDRRFRGTCCLHHQGWNELVLRRYHKRFACHLLVALQQ
jgi:hypothetical protein